MGIEDAQHARDGTVVNRLIGIHRLGVVLLHHLVNLGEAADAVADVALVGSRRGAEALAKQHAHTTTHKNDADNSDSRATRATRHFVILQSEGKSASPLLTRGLGEVSITFYASTLSSSALHWMPRSPPRVRQDLNFTDV